MILPVLQLCMAAFIPTALGYSLILLLFRQKPLGFVFSLALGYGLGMGILAQWMLLLGVMQWPMDLLTISIPLVIATGLIGFCLIKCKTPFPVTVFKASASKIDIAFILMAVFVCYYVYYVFWRALNIPIYSWDALATHAFNGKILFYERSLQYLSNFPHATYPLQVPLSLMWIALNLGQWDDVWVNIIFSLNFLAYLVIQHEVLRLFTNRRWSMLGLALLVSANFVIYHATIAYRDFTLLFYNCTAIILIIFWSLRKDRTFLFLAGLYAGFATFTKLEGVLYLLIYFILLLVVLVYRKTNLKTSIKQLLTFAIPGTGIFLFYFIYRLIRIGLVSDLAGRKDLDLTYIHINFSWDQIGKACLILQKFFENLFFTGNWNLLWLLFFLSLFNVKNLKARFEVWLFLLALGLLLGSYFLAFLLTQHASWITESDTALSRALLHFFPLTVILIVLLNAPLKEEK